MMLSRSSKRPKGQLKKEEPFVIDSDDSGNVESTPIDVIATTKNSSASNRGGVTSTCSFCGKQPAVVQVLRRQQEQPQRKTSLLSSSSSKKKPRGTGDRTDMDSTSIATRRDVQEESSSLCLIHYYSTSAIRVPVKDVKVIDSIELQKQLPQVQEIFADAFVQLQQELAMESARSFQEHNQDPLAILHKLNKSSTHTIGRVSANGRRKQGQHISKPVSIQTSMDKGKKGGGFLEDIAIPERLIVTQQKQAEQHKELIGRMNRAASEIVHAPVPTSSSALLLNTTTAPHRRRPKRQLIWNVLLDEDSQAKELHQDEEKQTCAGINSSSSLTQIKLTNITLNKEDHDGNDDDVVCRCRSHRVESLSMNTNRSQDIAKGETWGVKDRNDEVITRYRCHDCGAQWHQ